MISPRIASSFACASPERRSTPVIMDSMPSTVPRTSFTSLRSAKRASAAPRSRASAASSASLSIKGASAPSSMPSPAAASTRSWFWTVACITAWASRAATASWRVSVNKSRRSFASASRVASASRSATFASSVAACCARSSRIATRCAAWLSSAISERRSRAAILARSVSNHALRSPLWGSGGRSPVWVWRSMGRGLPMCYGSLGALPVACSLLDEKSAVRAKTRTIIKPARMSGKVVVKYDAAKVGSRRPARRTLKTRRLI